MVSRDYIIVSWWFCVSVLRPYTYLAKFDSNCLYSQDIYQMIQLSAQWPGLWMAVRLEVTLSWYRPHCFCCVNQAVLMLTRCIYITKQRGLYQSKVNPSLAAIERPGHQADNCKMVFWVEIESSHTFPKNLSKTNIQTIHINETGDVLLAHFVTYMFYNTWLIANPRETS